MTAQELGRIALQGRIVLIRLGLMPCLIATMLLLGSGTWIWLATHAKAQEEAQEHALAQAREMSRGGSASVRVVAQGPTAEQNLQNYYDALGDPSDAEQHIQTLFAIADETGLQLDQGEYKWEFDTSSHTYRHRILLPVKGSYRLVRQFCERTLLALPFASLDELSFKRESIDEEDLDGTLRFTIYLKDRPRAAEKAGPAK